MKKNSYPIIAFTLIACGVISFLVATYLFLWKSKYPISFEQNSQINSTALNDFGSLTVGTVGLFWSLAGVFLLIASLQEQKRATDENIKSIRLQQFENTFFQLISVHYQIVNSLKIILQDEFGRPEKDEAGNKEIKEGIGCFVALAEVIGQNYRTKKSENVTGENFSEVCSEQLYIYSAELGHYFGNFFNILTYVDDSKDISDSDRPKYVEILKSQLSNYELVILLYYDMVKVDKKRRELIEKYCLFENIDFETQYSDDYQKILIDPEIFIDDYPHLNQCFQKQNYNTPRNLDHSLRW